MVQGNASVIGWPERAARRTSMTQYGLKTTALDREGCLALHRATLEVLEGTGVEVQHGLALDLLTANGARVDGTRARIPAALVDEALSTAPRSIALVSRGASAGLKLEPGAVHFGTGSDCIYVLGPGTRDRRSGTLADVEEMAALQEKLSGIDFVLSMVHPHELPSDLAPVAQFAAMLRGTSKPLIMVPEDAAHLEVFNEMAAACGAGGSWAIYAMPTPPLVHGKESVDRLIGCARLGIPMVYATGLLPGATAPASAAGCVLLANAEMLSGLVITQLTSPGAPFVYGTSQGWMNPRSGHIVYCGPEEMAVQQASADLARHYGLPSFGTGGCSDSLMLDEQWAMEAAATLVTAASSGVTLLHDVGYEASGTASSHESMVVMDELIAWVKAYLAGVTIDEESLAVTEIAAAGPGGTHLARNYSRQHLRDFVRPRLVTQDSHEAWQAAGAPSLLERAAERTRELRESERAYRPSDDALRELERLEHSVT
jgi:trimethylamine---corrinoid protein Co-methyltransferase